MPHSGPSFWLLESNSCGFRSYYADFLPSTIFLLPILCGFCFTALPTFAQSHVSQVQALVREGQPGLDKDDFARAVQDFEQARQLAADSLDVAHGLLLSYLQAGRLS